MNKFSVTLGAVVAALLPALAPQSAQAKFSIPGYELVYNPPVETTLTAPDLRSTAEVWEEMIDNAKTRIDFGQFYASSQAGSLLDDVIKHLRAAGERGVKIRFMHEAGVDFSYPETLQELQTIPNLELRPITYADIAGGIHHAKYFVVDGKVAYVGSANFDWRALEHIHETSLRIDDPTTVSQLQSIFNLDWGMAGELADGEKVFPIQQVPLRTASLGNYLVASPYAYDPDGVPDSQTEVVRLLVNAKSTVRVQVMTYSPVSFGDTNVTYYAVLDNALRAAATRGVHVQLLVDSRNLDGLDANWVRSLAMVRNVEVKAAKIPEASVGPIPFARLIHSKFMTIDGKIAWVGTSNWAGGYMDNSRNLEIVMHNDAMAARLDQLFLQLWDSQYTYGVLNQDQNAQTENTAQTE